MLLQVRACSRRAAAERESSPMSIEPGKEVVSVRRVAPPPPPPSRAPRLRPRAPPHQDRPLDLRSRSPPPLTHPRPTADPNPAHKHPAARRVAPSRAPLRAIGALTLRCTIPPPRPLAHPGSTPGHAHAERDARRRVPVEEGSRSSGSGLSDSVRRPRPLSFLRLWAASANEGACVREERASI